VQERCPGDRGSGVGGLGSVVGYRVSWSRVSWSRGVWIEGAPNREQPRRPRNPDRATPIPRNPEDRATPITDNFPILPRAPSPKAVVCLPAALIAFTETMFAADLVEADQLLETAAGVDVGFLIVDQNGRSGSVVLRSCRTVRRSDRALELQGRCGDDGAGVPSCPPLTRKRRKARTVRSRRLVRSTPPASRTPLPP